MLLPLWLIACTTLETTGDGGFVGRITDHEGTPMSDLRVSSVEGDARTDADGRFAVTWKDPERHIRFKWGPVSVTRRYQDSDEGRVVSLRLPATRDPTVACPPTPCDLVATWALPSGFEGTFRTRCKVAGATLDVPGLPVDTPDLTCTVGKGTAAKALPLVVSDTGDVLGFRPAKAEVRVRIRQPRDGNVDCDVRYDDTKADLASDGTYRADATGPGLVSATCGGRPARPERVDPSVRGEVTLAWEPTGPTLGPSKGTVDLVAEDPGDWSLRLPASNDVRALPPLVAGTYRLVHLPEGTALALVAPPPDGEAGAIVWAPQEDGSRVGRLVVEGALPKGPLPERVATP